MDRRPYQEEAVAAVTAGLRDGGVGQLHAACGSGKTVMGRQAALRVLPAGGLVAVLVPSLALVAQTVAAWRCPAETAPRVLAVCSDDTVTDAPAHLADVPSPVTTNPTQIGQWLKAETTGLRLIVSTYMSAGRLHEALDATGYALGRGISYYRNLNNGTKRTSLAPERKEALDARGMVWRVAPARDLLPEEATRLTGLNGVALGSAITHLIDTQGVTQSSIADTLGIHRSHLNTKIKKYRETGTWPTRRTARTSTTT